MAQFLDKQPAIRGVPGLWRLGCGRDPTICDLQFVCPDHTLREADINLYPVLISAVQNVLVWSVEPEPIPVGQAYPLS